MKNHTQELLKNEIASFEINWDEIKSLLEVADRALQTVCAVLPSGIAKSIVCGAESVLALVISFLPSTEEPRSNVESKL